MVQMQQQQSLLPASQLPHHCAQGGRPPSCPHNCRACLSALWGRTCLCPVHPAAGAGASHVVQSLRGPLSCCPPLAAGSTLQELRPLMPRLTPEELAVAGHAVALSQWHQVQPTACCSLKSAERLPAHVPQCWSCCWHSCHHEAAFGGLRYISSWLGCLHATSLLLTGSLSHSVFLHCSAGGDEPLRAAAESWLLWPLRRTHGADRSRRQAAVHTGEQAPRVPTDRSCGGCTAAASIYRCCAGPSCWRDHSVQGLQDFLRQLTALCWRRCSLALQADSGLSRFG